MRLESAVPGAVPDTTSAFGAYKPPVGLALLMSLAHHAPMNWFGLQIVRLVRRSASRWNASPVDLSVGPVKMRCYLRDNCSEEEFAFLSRRYDRRERQALVDALPPNGTFVDIGANVGVYTLTVATQLGAEGRVVALEPNPPAFARLRFNVDNTRAGRADWPTVHLLQVGVAALAGEFELHLDPRNLGGSSIVPPVLADGDEHGNGDEAVRIACKPLVSILEELSIGKVDALKIDIEGAEDAALVPYLAEAADGSLPRVMVIENSENVWSLNLAGALRGRGYRSAMRSRTNTVYVRDGADAAVEKEQI